MSVSIRSSDVLQALAVANEMAIKAAWDLSPEQVKFWLQRLEVLENEKTPKTYLAVLCVALVARTLHEKSDLDVKAIKSGSDALGYSAPTIGSLLAAFCKEQGIDIRAKSSQPLNNQPFTYKTHITKDMAVKRGLQPVWEHFYDSLGYVQDLDSDSAASVLSLVFDRRRVYEKPESTVSSELLSLSEFDAFKVAIDEYVQKYSDQGRVGQAFCAALYSSIYGAEAVAQGQAQDPDATKKGDVHVSSGQVVWLWVEVKQKVISTGDVQGFLESVLALGGQRVAYFALSNAKYSSNIQEQVLQRFAAKNDLDLQMFRSPKEALDQLLMIAAGSFAEIVSTFSAEFKRRLVEVGVGETLLERLQVSLAPFVTFH